MSGYVHFTDEQKDRARQTDIVSLLERQGEKVRRAGSEYEWLDGTAKVSIRGNLWFHQYEREGGNAIDFVKRFFDKSYTEAMQFLLNEEGGKLKTSPPVEKKEEGIFEIPKRNETSTRAYDYLSKSRGIDREVLNEFFRKKLIYESEKYHNAVFVGYNPNGQPLHAHMRGTGTKSTFKGNVPFGMPEYSFHWYGSSGRLFLFEAPIDMLSFISMNKEGWKQHSYAACCGVSDRVAMQLLKDDPRIKRVSICLDNDEEGRKSSKRIKGNLESKGVQADILVPKLKDWNEDLLLKQRISRREPEEKTVGEEITSDETEEEQCPALVQ